MIIDSVTSRKFISPLHRLHPWAIAFLISISVDLFSFLSRYIAEAHRTKTTMIPPIVETDAIVPLIHPVLLSVSASCLEVTSVLTRMLSSSSSPNNGEPNMVIFDPGPSSFVSLILKTIESPCLKLIVLADDVGFDTECKCDLGLYHESYEDTY